MAWTIAACFAVTTACLSACVVIQMRMIDGLFRSLSTEYRINTDAVAVKEDKQKHYSMYKPKGDS